MSETKQYQNDGEFPFLSWIEEVKKEYKRIAGFVPEPFDEDAWLDFYNDDYTPTNAVEEDISNY